MSNKDMPGHYENRCVICKHSFMGQKHDRVCGLHTEYHKCERECTAFCQCINDAHKAALAELEGRNG